MVDGNRDRHAQLKPELNSRNPAAKRRDEQRNQDQGGKTHRGSDLNKGEPMDPRLMTETPAWN